jgi:hypothetical protein
MSQCFHSGCRCNESSVDRSGQKFCSDKCADVATQGSLAEAMCACGHSGCGEKTTAR